MLLTENQSNTYFQLCLLLQRYTFWSNSQQCGWNACPCENCACYCKDTHFEAIHNSIVDGSLFDTIVLATAKIHILKQFTTCIDAACKITLLCLLLQRYTFWSNSQLLQRNWSVNTYCACYCKDTHFEAIHNGFSDDSFSFKLCLLLQRYTFWSNSQLFTQNLILKVHCACYCKDTHFEAIHNTAVIPTRKPKLCLLLQRYTFWSNSQHIAICVLPDDIVLATAKIHILKQFTTCCGGKIQRQDCACYCKDTHFEAIHNSMYIGVS